MKERKLCKECAACWCFRQKRCDGRYHNVERIVTEGGEVVESAMTTLADFDGRFRYPGDAECAERLVTVEDGCICVNYAYDYPVRPLATFTKKEMAFFVVHLMEKTWFSIFLLRVFVRRVFALKKWTPTLELDVSRM